MTPKTKNRIAPFAYVALAALALAATACGGGGGDERHATLPEPSAPVAVTTAVAVLEQVPREVLASGGVEPWQRVSPGTKLMGRVERVPVREGDRVRRGQLLARLESRDLAAAVAQAEAAVAMAEAQLENAAAQRERIAALHGRGSVTDKNLEDATAGFRVATAGLAQAEANLVAAKVVLSYAEVTSPLDGWVVAKQVEVGDMASPGRPLFVLEDLSTVKITVEVPEAALAGLAAGDAAEVILDVLGGSVAATIDRVAPAGDPASRTFSVQLLLANPDGRIKSGMFARARFESGSRELLRVPLTALVARGQLTGVYVVEGERARLRWVTTGRGTGATAESVDDRVEILSGLEPGERYVTVVPPALSDGANVMEG